MTSATSELPRLERLLVGRAGLRVIGDVHGESEQLAAVLADAKRQNLALLFEGDIIDYGPDAPGAMRQVVEAVARGDAEMVPGNHEWKPYRKVFKGAKVEIDPKGLGLTLKQLEEHADGDALLKDFLTIAAEAPLWLYTGRDLFVHAAFSPAMLTRPEGPPLSNIKGARTPGWHLALFGETDGTSTPSGRPTRTYRWVDQVPEGVTVHIGHDIVSTTSIVRKRGALGGEAVLLDTGAGKGGRLSWLDLSAERILEPLAKLKAARPRRPAHVPEGTKLLVLLVGPSGAGKSTYAAAHYPPETVISTDAIRQELFGDHRTQMNGDAVFSVMRTRVAARLAQGLPTVIDATNLRHRDRLAAVDLAPSDTRVEYVVIDRPLEQKLRDGGWRLAESENNVIERHDEMFRSEMQHILRGDDLPNVVVSDCRTVARRQKAAGKGLER